MIPVFEPEIGEEEIAAVAAALQRGEISGSFGKTIEKFEDEFAAYCGSKYGVAVSSGTAALQLAVRVAGVKAGDEVLVSATTNVATALACYHNQAIPVPVDSEPETWNLNLDLLESLITPRTRAIVPVHIYGHPVDMDGLMEIAQRHGLAVIEDAAEAHGATCRGKKVGSFGQMGCFSFYANKIVTTGEGGMVVTDDAALAEQLRLLRNVAFAEPRFVHQEAGYNFRMTGFQAAMGCVQLEKIEKTIAAKRRVAQTYTELLQEIVGLQLPIEKDWARNVYWMYGIVVHPEFGISRDELMKRLCAGGVQTRTFFCPMNQQPFLREQKGWRDVACSVSDDLWRQGMYLPGSASLSREVISNVVNTIKSAQKQ